ncbi:MAG: gluconate 2-dehydrogenase subunit 3 family protein [Gemmatimonadetes bacterium]|nr:gluconate 2-dehydrogenase subunit 3 family protein [Gemmatimonadota bacterium]
MTHHQRLSESELVTRREAIQRVTALLGGVALVGGEALLTGRRGRAQVTAAPFTADEIAFLDEVADTILPATGTPGAKAAQTGAFMALMVQDTYDERNQKIFRDGMQKIDDITRQAYGVDFLQAKPAQRLAVLEEIDREQKAYSDARAEGTPAHYFRMMKELALLGYFTSEIGCTQAQRYIESPGRFDPCVPYTAGERTWAPHA